MNRWVRLGVIAGNIGNVGRAMEKQAASYKPPSHHLVRYGRPGHPGRFCILSRH